MTTTNDAFAMNLTKRNWNAIHFFAPYFSNFKKNLFLINKCFLSLRANYTKFLQYVEEREKYTSTLKQENTFKQFVQMNIETNKYISAAKCDFQSWNDDRTYDNDVHVRCDCFTPIYNCLRRINTTLPNHNVFHFKWWIWLLQGRLSYC